MGALVSTKFDKTFQDHVFLKAYLGMTTTKMHCPPEKIIKILRSCSRWIPLYENAKVNLLTKFSNLNQEIEQFIKLYTKKLF